MTPTHHQLETLTPQEKLNLIKTLQKKIETQPNSDINPIIHYEKQQLLPLIATGELTKVTSATIAYLPIKDSTISQPIKTIFQNLPTLFNIYRLSFGSIGLIVLPIDENDLYESKTLIQTKLKQAIQLCSFIGANCISLAGLLPSITQYGKEIQSLIPKNIKLSVTTGHATTTATVLITLENILQQNQRKITNEILGFLGLGSIGQSTLKLILTTLPHPKEIILCDIPAMKNLINKLISDIKQLGYQGKITYFESKENAPEKFYKASVIIGATNQANILKINKLNPNTIVIDDSIPHCFDADQAYQRMQTKKDIICIEAGIINAPNNIQEHRYYPDEIKPYIAYLPRIIINRKNKEITSCILSSLLTATHNELPPSTGITNNNLAKKHLNILNKMNFHATNPRINGKDIPI
tara:strand:- start:11910 stop:13142 length:1233 start_codon:yes stop_codon:yes gene_type:complete